MAKKKTKKSKDKKRVDQDTSPLGPWTTNFDYGGPEDGSDVGSGTGLFQCMNDGKCKSVDEFQKKKKKRPHARKFALLYIIEQIARGEALDQET
jgi:hypothetical protein